MTILYILGGIILLLLILALIAPKTYDVSRSVVVEKPRKEVFEYLRFLKNMDDWSPWAKTALFQTLEI